MRPNEKLDPIFSTTHQLTCVYELLNIKTVTGKSNTNNNNDNGVFWVWKMVWIQRGGKKPRVKGRTGWRRRKLVTAWSSAPPAAALWTRPAQPSGRNGKDSMKNGKLYEWLVWSIITHFWYMVGLIGNESAAPD